MHSKALGYIWQWENIQALAKVHLRKPWRRYLLLLDPSVVLLYGATLWRRQILSCQLLQVCTKKEATGVYSICETSGISPM